MLQNSYIYKTKFTDKNLQKQENLKPVSHNLMFFKSHLQHKAKK